jgi:hypothetical protein
VQQAGHSEQTANRCIKDVFLDGSDPASRQRLFDMAVFHPKSLNSTTRYLINRIKGFIEVVRLGDRTEKHPKLRDTMPTPFGLNFVVEGALTSPGGRVAQVRVIWFIANGQETATLATAYPLDE